ncbi:MAG: hypothetical protein ABIP97_08440 [Chthoniobacterales bacterium]
MKLPVLLSALALFVGLSACTTTKDPAMDRRVGEQWLAPHNQAPGINLSGRWHSDELGNAAFVQGHARINGQLAQYTVYGRASGTKAYLLLSDGTRNYSAILSMANKNEMTGFYSTSVPFNPANQKVLHFRHL